MTAGGPETVVMGLATGGILAVEGVAPVELRCEGPAADVVVLEVLNDAVGVALLVAVVLAVAVGRTAAIVVAVAVTPVIYIHTYYILLSIYVTDLCYYTGHYFL